MGLATNCIETNHIQGNIRFLGTDTHELKKEFSVVADQTRQ